MSRGLDKRFLDAMRFKLASGRRKGYVGWDRRWENCSFPYSPTGVHGFFIGRLQDEFRELIVALHEGDKAAIASECADIANFAMMLCDIEGAMDFCPAEEAYKRGLEDINPVGKPQTPPHEGDAPPHLLAGPQSFLQNKKKFQ